MNRTPPRDPSSVGSFAELRGHYKTLIAQLDECHRQRRAIEGVSKANRKDLIASRGEAKSAKGQLVTLSKKQKAKEEASKAGYWSGGAAICVALFYELCKASDQWIGGRQYQEFWQHEAMISTLTFLTTAIFAWVYKTAHPDSK
jgi:hypothetical protein